MVLLFLVQAQLIFLIVRTAESYNIDKTILICEPNKICQCYDGIVSCDNVTWIDPANGHESFKRLQTANVVFKETKTFIVERAFFRFNDIRKLEQSKIAPGHEESIKELDFSHNRISQISAFAFDKMDKLEILRLRSNKLQQLSRSSFAGGPIWSLLELDLSNNQLTNISGDIFEEMPYLAKLILDGNRYLNLSKDAFGLHLSKLTTLSMNDCGIEDLEDNLFDELINLERLFIRQNPFVEIPHALHDIPSLVALDMSYTNITEIEPYAFVFDHKIQTLRLQGLHYLYTIHTCAFCGLDSLKELFLTNATELYVIKEEAFGAFGLPALRTLDLENANLTSLARDMIDYRKLEYLKLGGNPWNCSYDLSWLFSYGLDLNRGSKPPECRSSSNLMGVKLFSLVRNQFCPFVREKRLIISFSMVLLGIMICALCYDFTMKDRFRNIFHPAKLPNVAYTILKEMDESTIKSHNRLIEECT